MSDADVETLLGCIERLAARPSYQGREREVVLEVKGRSIPLRLPGGGWPPPEDEELRQMLNKLGDVTVHSGPAGERLRVYDLEWYGTRERPGRDMRVTFSLGAPIHAVVFSPDLRGETGPLIEERYDIRAGIVETDLTPLQCIRLVTASTAAGLAQPARLTLVEVDGERVDFPLTQTNSPSRNEALLASSIRAKAQRVVFRGRMPRAGGVVVFRLPHAGSARHGGLECELVYQRPPPSPPDGIVPAAPPSLALSQLTAYANLPNLPGKVQERIDFATGASTTELSAVELAEVLQPELNKEKGEPTTLEIDGRTFHLRDPNSGGKSPLRRMFRERLQAHPRVFITSRTHASTGGDFRRLGLRCFVGSYTDRLVRVAFQRGEARFVEVFSDVLKGPHNAPLRLLREYRPGGAVRTSLSLGEIGAEMQQIPGYQFRSREILLRRGDEEARVLTANANGSVGKHFMDSLLRQRVRSWGSLQMTGALHKGRLDALGVQHTATRLKMADHVELAIDAGVVQTETLYSSRYRELDGSLRMVWSGRVDGPALDTHLSLAEIIDELRGEPDYERWDDRVFLEADGEFLAFRYSGAASNLITLGKLAMARAHQVTIWKRANSVGKIVVMGLESTPSFARINCPSRAEFVAGNCVTVETGSVPEELKDHPGLKAVTIVEEIQLSSEHNEGQSFQPVADALAANPSLVAAREAPVRLELSRLVLQVLPPKEKPVLTELERVRLRLPHLKSPVDWDQFASEYDRLADRGAGFAATHVMLAHSRQWLKAETGSPPIQRMLDLAAGSGVVAHAIRRIPELARAHLVQLDSSFGMLGLASDQGRVVANAAQMPLRPLSFDFATCTAAHRLVDGRPDPAGRMQIQLASLLKPGGRQCLQAQASFHPDWIEGLRQLGMEVLPPFNARFTASDELLAQLDEPGQAQLKAALSGTRFLFAVKNSDATGTPDPSLFRFVKPPVLDEQVAALRVIVAQACQAQSADDLIASGEQLAHLLSCLSIEERAERVSALSALTRVYLERCFKRTELVARGEANRSEVSGVATMRSRIETAQREIGSDDEQHQLNRFLATSLRVVEQLEGLELAPGA